MRREAQLGTGFEPDLVQQHLAGVPERVQRVRLPAAAVQRTHPLAVQPLAQQMLAGQLVGSRRWTPTVAPVGQRGIDRGLTRPEPGGCPRARRISAAANGSSARSSSGGPRQSASASCTCEPFSSEHQEALEAQRVDQHRVDAQLVAPPARDDLCASARELLAQLRHEHLHRLVRRRRRPFTPQPVDQPVRGDRRVGLQRQDREQRPWLGTPEGTA